MLQLERSLVNDGRAPNIPTYKSTGHAFYTIASYSRAKQRQLKDNEEHLSPSLHLVSAAEAGALVCLCTNPIWLVKTRLQLQTAMHPNRPYSGLSDLRVLEGSTEALHPTC